jgi:hypothetical protein
VDFVTLLLSPALILVALFTDLFAVDVRSCLSKLRSKRRNFQYEVLSVVDEFKAQADD